MKKIKIELFGGNLCAVVFLILLVMKLCSYGLPATWSWWIIFAPLWVPAVFVLSCLGTYVLCMLIYIGAAITVEWFKSYILKRY